jgi:hypothetical protein
VRACVCVCVRACVRAQVGIVRRTEKEPASGDKPPVFEWKLEQGPKLDVPRGACAALPLKLDGGENLPNVS